jgi:HlyD family secretion protein
MGKRKIGLRAIAVLLALVIAAATGYFIVAVRPVSVTVVSVSENVPVRVFGLGTVEARIVSRIGFEVGAALAELTADHGDSVVRGDVLARLSSAEQQARVARAEAGLLGAEVNVRKAEANVVRAQAILAQRRATNRRKQELVGDRVVSQQSADETQRDEDIAAAELTVARAEVDVANAMANDARAALSYELTVLGQYVLAAPYDGVVVERHTEVGTVVKAGDVIYTLMAPESVWALAYVDEARAGAIVEGQTAEVRLRSLTQSNFNAQVVRIGIESDRVNEERRVWVKCTSCPPRIFLGEQAEIRITVATLDMALLVPEVAVTGFDGRNGTVWIVRDRRLSRARLAFGHRSEDARLEVIDGLPDGARIVAAIVPGLKDGRAADIVEAARP